MINVRQAMAAAWRRPVPDQLWDYLVEKGYVGEVEEDRMPIGDLVEEAEQVLAAARSAASLDDKDIARQAAGVAAVARIDALSAIYAAWARDDLEVRGFRSHPAFASGLLASEEVGPWILEQRAASAPDGNGDQYLFDAFCAIQAGSSQAVH